MPGSSRLPELIGGFIGGMFVAAIAIAAAAVMWSR